MAQPSWDQGWTMTDHPIFEEFSKVPYETTGLHIFDFLGGATRVAYNRGWAAHAMAAGKSVAPQNWPPKNEHYLDWIALLTAVSKAKGVFRMAELGAGWAPWLTRGALAARQRAEIASCELLAVEADPTHYGWVLEHFRDNGLDPEAYHLLQGAVTNQPGRLRFPVIADPDVNYGASLQGAQAAQETIDVRGYAIPELLDRFSGPLDFLHIDIQGAEYDAVPPHLDLIKDRVRAIMIGTHNKDDLHDGLTDQFRAAGWAERLNLGRNRLNDTPWGPIQTNDGFLWFENTHML